MATKFVAVNVTPEARDILRLMAVTVSAAAGRRVSMSDALAVIDSVARRHPEEMAVAAREFIERESSTPDRKEKS